MGCEKIANLNQEYDDNKASNQQWQCRYLGAQQELKLTLYAVLVALMLSDCAGNALILESNLFSRRKAT